MRIGRLLRKTDPGAPAPDAHGHAAAAPVSHVHSTAFLTRATSLKIALLVLNVDRLSVGEGVGVSFGHLWNHASLRLCADGAANSLHDSLDAAARATMLPDLIKGDLDSIRPEVADFYRRSGVEISRDRDQDTHDFEKCLHWLDQRQRESGERFSVVTVGAFGGRLDQQFANLNMAYTWLGKFDQFYLLSPESLAFLLRPGSHRIEVNREAESGSCGLVPLGGRCDGVRTAGLRWNLDGGRALEFGSLVSSSNEIVSPTVTIETSSPLLWTTGLVTHKSKL